MVTGTCMRARPRPLGSILHPRSWSFLCYLAHVDSQASTVCATRSVEEPQACRWASRSPPPPPTCLRLHEDGQDPRFCLRQGGRRCLSDRLFPPGLSVPNVHGALAPLAIPSAAAAAAAAGRIAIPGLAGAGNAVLLVSNLNPEVCGSSRLSFRIPTSEVGVGSLLSGPSAD